MPDTFPRGRGPEARAERVLDVPADRCRLRRLFPGCSVPRSAVRKIVTTRLEGTARSTARSAARNSCRCTAGRETRRRLGAGCRTSSRAGPALRALPQETCQAALVRRAQDLENAAHGPQTAVSGLGTCRLPEKRDPPVSSCMVDIDPVSLGSLPRRSLRRPQKPPVGPRPRERRRSITAAVIAECEPACRARGAHREEPARRPTAPRGGRQRGDTSPTRSEFL